MYNIISRKWGACFPSRLIFLPLGHTRTGGHRRVGPRARRRWCGWWGPAWHQSGVGTTPPSRPTSPPTPAGPPDRRPDARCRQRRHERAQRRSPAGGVTTASAPSYIGGSAAATGRPPSFAPAHAPNATAWKENKDGRPARRIRAARRRAYSTGYCNWQYTGAALVEELLCKGTVLSFFMGSSGEAGRGDALRRRLAEPGQALPTLPGGPGRLDKRHGQASPIRPKYAAPSQITDWRLRVVKDRTSFGKLMPNPHPAMHPAPRGSHDTSYTEHRATRRPCGSNVKT